MNKAFTLIELLAVIIILAIISLIATPSIINATTNKNIYSMGITDTQAYNYAASANVYGDAVYETSNLYSGSKSWNGDTSNMVYDSNPWFWRGGNFSTVASAGVFNFHISSGYAGTGNISFHVVGALK